MMNATAAESAKWSRALVMGCLAMATCTDAVDPDPSSDPFRVTVEPDSP